MEHPRIKSILQTVVIASAGLLLAAAIPLARDALTGGVTVAIAAVSFVLLLTTELDTLLDYPRRGSMLVVGGFTRRADPICIAVSVPAAGHDGRLRKIR